MAFGLRGRNAVLSRPAQASPGSEGAAHNLWARNKSSPTASDGYELSADDINELLGQLRALLGSLGGDIDGQTGYELASAMEQALASKLSIADGLAGLEDDDEFVRMTVAERAKLESLNSGYKGYFSTMAALIAAHPTGAAGDWAIIGGSLTAIWDVDADPPGWIDTGLAPVSIEWSAVTSKPSTFPPSAHSHAVSDVTGLGEYLALLAPLTRAIATSGLASGGGDLSANLTIAVEAATAAEYRVGSAQKALSAQNAWAAMAEVVLTDASNIAWDMSTGIDFTVTLGGNRTLGNPTSTLVGKKGRIRVVQDATGSRTLSFGTNFKFAGGTALNLSTAANAHDYLYYDVRSPTVIIISALKDVK